MWLLGLDDGSVCALGDGGKVTRVQVAKRRISALLTAGDEIIAASEDGLLARLSKTLQVRAKIETKHRVYVGLAQAQYDGAPVIAAADGQALSWAVPASLEEINVLARDGFRPIGLGAGLLVASDDGRLARVDPSNGTFDPFITALDAASRFVVAAPHWALLSHDDGRVAVYDTRSPKAAPRVLAGAPLAAACAFGPDRFALADRSGVVSTIQAASGEQRELVRSQATALVALGASLLVCAAAEAKVHGGAAKWSLPAPAACGVALT